LGQALQKTGVRREWPLSLSYRAALGGPQLEPSVAAVHNIGRCVRAIGVCNFNSKHLNDLIARSVVVPAVNQVELHPFFTQKELRQTDAKLGVITQAWSPIGGVKRYWVQNSEKPQDPLSHSTVKGLADKYGRTPAQIVLRWQIQLGNSAIPKSVRRERIAENINIFDFALTQEEVASIDALDTGQRGGPDPELVNPQLFNFKIED
jgi:diketogulonate reductase-like aldo/keto reductase